MLRIWLLGSVRVSHDATPAAGVTRSMQALLAYLVLRRDRGYSREVLATALWGDYPEARARNALNTALWRLRQVLEPRGTRRGSYLSVTAAGDVAFNWGSEHWVDAEALEARLAEVLPAPGRAVDVAEARALTDALRLYQGELLEGFDEEWAVRERSRLSALVLDAQQLLLSYHRDRGAPEAALASAREILRLDPFREEIQREVMRLYAASGKRAQALRHYENWRRTLQEELGISPDAETRALHGRILNEEPAAVAATLGTITLPADFLDELRCAMQNLDALRAQLAGTIHRLEDPAPDSSSTPPLRILSRVP